MHLAIEPTNTLNLEFFMTDDSFTIKSSIMMMTLMMTIMTILTMITMMINFLSLAV